MFDDPVLQRSYFLDEYLLLGILFLRGEVNLLLHAIGAQGALVLEAARGDVVITGALGTEADVDGLHIGLCVPLAGEQVGLGDTVLGRLHGGDEGAQTVDLHGVALGEELGDTARHLGEHTLDDVAAIDTVVAGHVITEASQGDGLLLLSLRIVLPVTGVVGVRVLANVDLELWIFYCHDLKV